MALRPRALITTPYPSAAATARVLGVSDRRLRQLRAMVTEYLERRGGGRALDRNRTASFGKRRAKTRTTAGRRKARRS
jgi:hypothetical protein